MEIELEEMEHGKALHLNTFEDDKKKKIQTMKTQKQYPQLLEYATSLPPTRDKFMLKANALMHLRRWDDVIVCCNQGLEIEEDSEFYNMKGRAFGKLNKMEEKAENIALAIKIDSTIPAYHRNYGAALYKLKKYQDAINSHRIAIEKQPNNSINYHNVGAAYFRLEQYEEAKGYFMKSIQKNDKQALSHSWLGDCFKQLGQPDKAIDCYHKAYELSGKQVYKQQRDKLKKQLNPNKGFFSKFFN